MSLPDKTKSDTARTPLCKYGGDRRKETVLTPGGLARVPDKKDVKSYRNKPSSDMRLNCKKSAEAIVIPDGDEGWNRSVF